MSEEKKSSQTIIKGLIKLSRREGEILALLADGKTSQAIAEELFLSVRTVENHRYAMCKKLGLNGRGALRQWIRNSLKNR